MTRLKIYVKHIGSCLPDCHFEVEVDEMLRVVVISAGHFDSYLFGILVTQVLPENHEVIAFRDDNAGWTPPPAQYRLRLRFGDQTFRASVVKLCHAVGGGVAVRLDVYGAQTGLR